MRVTISKNGEWHRNVQLIYARGIIEDDLDRFVPVWQVKAAIFDHRIFHGWNISEVR